MSLQPPFLSIADPPESGEGSIDALGLQATYERLAERIYPFITVRMSRPRFLTAIAAAARICDGLEEDVASDGVTPAWLVCEWYMVEGLVRRREALAEGEQRGIPGSNKVARALNTGRKLDAAAYLKTPTVFGFTGVYKTLAIGLEIVTEDLELDEGGFELLKAWESAERLRGFFEGGEGVGAQFRNAMRDAVEDGMRLGYTRRAKRWATWDDIVAHLNPHRARKREADVIWSRLLDPNLRANPRDIDATRMRREVLLHLEREGAPIDGPWEECEFFRRVIARTRGVSPDLTERLTQIDCYESLCRTLDDAFRLILHLSAAQGGAPVTERMFAHHELPPVLARRIKPSIRAIASAYTGSEWEVEVLDLLDRYQEATTPHALYSTVLEHHDDAQKAKPPDGKRPWVEDLGPRGVVARPQYYQDAPPEGSDFYLHDYRTASVSGFLQDLRRYSS